eukprot:3886334-Lingulodinium_polyedra.AAC.1
MRIDKGSPVAVKFRRVFGTLAKTDRQSVARVDNGVQGLVNFTIEKQQSVARMPLTVRGLPRDLFENIDRRVSDALLEQ